MTKTIPFDLNQIQDIIKKYPTPFHIYDEKGIRETSKSLYNAFSWTAFTNYFAVKALPNPYILELVKSEGMGVDCSSMAELVLAERSGFKGEQIIFSSNDTPSADFNKAADLKAIINLDDISHINFLKKATKELPEIICFRFNPGPERGGNKIIGNPAEAKYGLTREQLLEAYNICKNNGVTRFGLHTMLASNELNVTYFAETVKMMFELAVEIKQKLNIKLEFIDLGGGIGIPYSPEQDQFDIKLFSKNTKDLYQNILKPHELRPKLYMECGRYITGPHGYLVSTVLHIKHTYRDYVGLDASMANLMRPGMYGAYHHISVLGKENDLKTHTYDVTGALCENNDKFAIQRSLPEIEEGDIVVLHDTGAHGYSMGFNYNGMLRSAELLLRENGEVKLIRRAETLEDYFATLKF